MESTKHSTSDIPDPAVGRNKQRALRRICSTGAMRYAYCTLDDVNGAPDDAFDVALLDGYNLDVKFYICKSIRWV